MNSAERHEARYQRRKAAREEKRRAKLDLFDNFDRATSPQALRRANWDARRGVLFKASVARYNAHFAHYAVLQSKELHEGKDVRQGFYSFDIIERGKKRNIHSLHYAERVIRRAICVNALVPILSSNLIYDNGASLAGKGVSFSAGRCKTHLHQYFRETGSNDGYILIIDFKGYFDHILHKPLYGIFDRYIFDKKLNALCKSFVSSPDRYRPEHEYWPGGQSNLCRGIS